MTSRSHIRTLFSVITLFPKAHPGLTIVFWVVVAISGVLPIAATIATTRLARVAASYLGDGAVPDVSAAMSALSPPVILVALVFFSQQFLGPLRFWVTDALGDRLSELWRERVMAASLRPAGVAHLESAESADRIWVAAGIDQRSLAPAALVAAVGDIATWRIQGFGSALLLLAFAWWMPVALVFAWLPLWYVIAARTRIQMTNAELGSSDLRRASYFRRIAMSPREAKEVRLYRLQQWILRYFDRHYASGEEEMWRDRGFTRWAFVPGLLAPAAVSMFILAQGVQSAVGGSTEIAEITLMTLAVIGSQRIGKAMAWWTRSFYGAGAVESGVDLERSIDAGAAALPGSGELDEGIVRIVFDQVSFTYPGSGIRVFESLDLELVEGQSVGIVGPNGVGKTTLVKLLSRLYDPQAGSIRVNDISLVDLDPDAWRSHISVIFQDFLRLELSLMENIGAGCIDHPEREQLVERAALRSGIPEFADTLEYGYSTTLARGYPGGRDLSGGEWQRVALARAFAAVERGARLLILDEPTANLDVDAENEFYDRFIDMTRDLTTILISHRMSSVRRCDRICVLEGGTVVESGTHAELMGRGGRYAYMFELQARQFTKGEDSGDVGESRPEGSIG